MRKQVELQVKEVHHMDGLADNYTQVMFKKDEQIELRSLIIYGPSFPDLVPGDKLLVTISSTRPVRRQT